MLIMVMAKAQFLYLQSYNFAKRYKGNIVLEVVAEKMALRDRRKHHYKDNS